MGAFSLLNDPKSEFPTLQCLYKEDVWRWRCPEAFWRADQCIKVTSELLKTKECATAIWPLNPENQAIRSLRRELVSRSQALTQEASLVTHIELVLYCQQASRKLSRYKQVCNWQGSHGMTMKPDQVSQLVYEVGQLTAIRWCGRLGTRVDFQLESINPLWSSIPTTSFNMIL